METNTNTLTKLALITERARKEPKSQFTSLAHLLDEGFLAECFMRLERNRASGIDGVSWKAYGENLEENLRGLVARMKAKRYKPQPSRRTYIPKDEHSERPLGLPSLEDKIVQKGIAWVLESIYKADFLDCSWGFRQNRGCHQALDVLDKAIMTKPDNHVVEADIKGFFDNVSHAWLMRCLGERISDPSFLTNQVGYIWGENSDKDDGLVFSDVAQKGQDDGGMGSTGTFGWGGYFSTVYFADPKEKLIEVLMKQTQEADSDDTNWKFQVLVGQAVDD